MPDHHLIPRDRCTEHLAVTTAYTPLLQRLVLYHVLEMLDLRQLNDVVSWTAYAEAEIADGVHGDFHRDLLRRARQM